MASLKGLAKETAIYGVSSIVGRFLNYLLVPLYTAALSAQSGGYGVITNVYSYVALLLVLLTYGMETTFFRFSNKSDEDAATVYSTTLISVGSTSLMFIAIVIALLGPISRIMGYGEHPEYIGVMACVVAIDAFQSIPFAYLRYKKRAVKFAALKLLFIVLNVSLNLLYFVLLPRLYSSHPGIVGHIYDPAIGVGYAFFINLVCTALITFFFKKELLGFKWTFDKALIKRMLRYSMPILILGIAGILNQTADKILFPFLCQGEGATRELGIYGAASKIAMIMALITQAFRYAYEPFVFGKAKDGDSRETYAKAMKYFIIFTLLSFLAVVAYLDILRYLIAPDYWSGLRVVPIVMAAEMMMGVYFNLSFWYKLIDKTMWGALFSGIGCAALVAVNVAFVPRYGYMACAWAGCVGYGTAMLLSYFVGQRKYPIDYPLRSIAGYVLLAAAIYVVFRFLPDLGIIASAAVKSVFLVAFLAVVIRAERIPIKLRRRP